MVRLAVGKTSKLSKRLRIANETEVNNGDGLIRIKDREGYCIEQSDILSKYL